MRTIKFRAWDLDTQKMIRPPVEFKQLLGQISNRADNSIGGDAVRRHKLEWMQFTGLKDKNGTEIYEGDGYQVMGNRVYEVRWLDGECQHEYYGGCFGLWHSDELFFPFDENALKNGAIIGNIHENPELAKA